MPNDDNDLFLRIENSTMCEAMRDTAHRLGFVYLGAQGFAGAVHRAVERAALRHVDEMVVASSHLGTHRFPAAPEVVAAWAEKIGQRAMLEWALVPLEDDAPAQEAQSASEGVGAGVLHPSYRGGL